MLNMVVYMSIHGVINVTSITSSLGTTELDKVSTYHIRGKDPNKIQNILMQSTFWQNISKFRRKVEGERGGAEFVHKEVAQQGSA